VPGGAGRRGRDVADAAVGQHDGVPDEPGRDGGRPVDAVRALRGRRRGGVEPGVAARPPRRTGPARRRSRTVPRRPRPPWPRPQARPGAAGRSRRYAPATAPSPSSPCPLPAAVSRPVPAQARGDGA
jgi:hypothetical protein